MLLAVASFCAILRRSTHLLPRLYISVTDYVKSLMLFEVLYPPRGVATLPEDIIPQTTQFWTSNIIEALIHIHNQGVAYRDLKPENLLVNEQVSVEAAMHLVLTTQLSPPQLPTPPPPLWSASGPHKGYIILIDLGLAKRVPYKKQTDEGEVMHDMTYTLCGTFEYVETPR